MHMSRRPIIAGLRPAQVKLAERLSMNSAEWIHDVFTKAGPRSLLGFAFYEKLLIFLIKLLILFRHLPVYQRNL